MAARLSTVVVRLGPPAVIGVVLGKLALVGLGLFEPATADPVLAFLAQLGVIPEAEFGVTVIVVILTTPMTPLILPHLLRRPLCRASRRRSEYEE